MAIRTHFNIYTKRCYKAMLAKGGKLFGGGNTTISDTEIFMMILEYLLSLKRHKDAIIVSQKWRVKKEANGKKQKFP